MPVMRCDCGVCSTDKLCQALLHGHAGSWWANNGGRKWLGGRGPQHSVNFITAHDGFTLSDLVAYNKKHNEANGEGNRCAKPEQNCTVLHSHSFTSDKL